MTAPAKLEEKAMAWIQNYHGSIDTTALIMAHEAGYREAIKDAAGVAEFGAGNMEIYTGNGVSEQTRRELDFAAKQARQLATAIRKLGQGVSREVR